MKIRQVFEDGKNAQRGLARRSRKPEGHPAATRNEVETLENERETMVQEIAEVKEVVEKKDEEQKGARHRQKKGSPGLGTSAFAWEKSCHPNPRAR